jgi:hypothetical protein
MKAAAKAGTTILQKAVFIFPASLTARDWQRSLRRVPAIARLCF